MFNNLTKLAKVLKRKTQKSFLNYFESKMILLNIYLFKYIVSHIMTISHNNAFLCYRTNQVFCVA